MPSNLTVGTIDDKQKFVLDQTLNQTLVNDGHVVIDLDTENSFIDKDIHIDLTVPSAADPSLSITDLTGSLSMGDASNGIYSPTVSLSGNANVATAGWITAGNHAVSDSSVAVGTVNQSTLVNGSTAIASGDDVVPAVSDDQTINISEGYNTARTVVVKSMDSADTQKATVASANLSVGTADLTIAYDSSNHDFNVTGSKTIAAPSVTTPGFISTTAGTKTTGTATIAADLDEIAIGVSASDKKVTPVLARAAITEAGVIDAASGAGNTTAPSGGVYVKVGAAAVADTITATPTVTTAGYGTTDHSQATNTTINVGTNAAADLYVPITEGTVAARGATISSVTPSYNEAGYFDVTGAADIPAPTASTAGYVGEGAGTLSGLTDGAEVKASVAKIAIAASVSDNDVTVTPVISKNAATNVDASAATTTQPSSGFYVAVDTAAISETVTTSASVTSNGYGTTTSGQYTDASSATVTAGAAASGAYYVPITAGTLANTATSGTTYSDLSSSAPIIPSDGYLYINKGYYADSKISLARLVPDEATITYASGAGYMLSGQTAYDADGKLVTGTIPTYTGSYEIS